ncbi:MAG: DbpA RNA binding domain-containing protein, partial [Polyangiaceae bacterium]|nr:DbpA RNA binding domain-containing protein [Polyangiaceae bacterium]
AARGIDVHDIARVIQTEPPTDVDTYTHRSGRTGRAGKRGTSVLFVAPSHYPAIARGLSRAKIAHRVEPIPSADAIRRAREDKLVAWLSRHEDREALDAHAMAIAERVVDSPDRVVAVARLIEKAGLRGPTAARAVRAPAALPDERRPRKHAAAAAAAAPRGSSLRDSGDGVRWVTFRVTWGGRHGADARRLLAVACRRGDVRGDDVGAIRVEAAYSLVDVAAPVADHFEERVAEPDPRNPLVRITRTRQPAQIKRR